MPLDGFAYAVELTGGRSDEGRMLQLGGQTIAMTQSLEKLA